MNSRKDVKKIKSRYETNVRKCEKRFKNYM